MGAELARLSRREFLQGAFSSALLASSPALVACGGSKENSIDLPKRSFKPEISRWAPEKEGKNTVYLWGRVKNPDRILFATCEDNIVTVFSSVNTQTGYQLVFQGEVCELIGQPWTAPFLSEARKRFGLVVNKNICKTLFPTLRPTLINKLDEAVASTESFAFLKDGVLANIGDSPFLFTRGRRYAVEPQSVDLFDYKRRFTIPSQFVRSIPESENVVNFREGEVLVGSGGQTWYLQNGRRYEIKGSIGSFATSRHKNFKAYEVPNWIVDSVKKSENFPATFPDQYGREIDARSSRLIVLMAGCGSTSEKAQEDFSRIVEGLKLLGWRDNQILFVSYNVSREIVNGKVKWSPGLYTNEHARSPLRARENCSRFLNWLRVSAPLSQVTLCGFSMGGDAVLHNAVLHKDMVCRAVTINSPLTGIDKGMLSNPMFDAEDFLANFCGKVSFLTPNQCEAVRFYETAGESSTYRENVEGWVDELIHDGIEFWNFTAIQDPFVPTAHATVPNSSKKIGNYEVQTRWDLSHVGWDPKIKLTESAHGYLLKYDPFILELLRVVGAP